MDRVASEHAPPHLQGGQDTALKPFPWTGLTIFVIVLTLIGVAAVPRHTLSDEEIAGDRMAIQARHAVQELRAAVDEYTLDHGTPPGVPPGRSDSLLIEAAEERWLRRQLTQSSDQEGETVPQPLESHPFGPYLTQGIPANPLNGLSSVRILDRGEAMPERPDGESGYLYDPVSGELRINALGQILGTEAQYYDL